MGKKTILGYFEREQDAWTCITENQPVYKPEEKREPAMQDVHNIDIGLGEEMMPIKKALKDVMNAAHRESLTSLDIHVERDGTFRSINKREPVSVKSIYEEQTLPMKTPLSEINVDSSFLTSLSNSPHVFKSSVTSSISSDGGEIVADFLIGGEEIPAYGGLGETDLFSEVNEDALVAKEVAKDIKRMPEHQSTSTKIWYPPRCLIGMKEVKKLFRRCSDVQYIHALVMGPSNSGKAALLDRYIHDYFTEKQHYKAQPRPATITNVLESHRTPFILLGEDAYCPILHNTSGVEINEDFLKKDFVQNIDCLFLVYNITDRSTFRDLQRLYQMFFVVWKSCGFRTPLPAVLVGTCLDRVNEDHNKCTYIADLAFSELRAVFQFELTTLIHSFVGESDMISWFEGWRLAKRWNIPFVEVSAKTGLNVEEAFHCLFRESDSSILCSNRPTFHRQNSVVAEDDTCI